MLFGVKEMSFAKYRPKTTVVREACALHIANITQKELLGETRRR